MKSEKIPIERAMDKVIVVIIAGCAIGLALALAEFILWGVEQEMFPRTMKLLTEVFS